MSVTAESFLHYGTSMEKLINIIFIHLGDAFVQVRCNLSNGRSREAFENKYKIINIHFKIES